jgi:hypothetical protein
MPVLDRTTFAITACLALAALAGLIHRQRLTACRSFGLYLTSAVLSHGLVAFWPGRFWTWEFWLATDALHALARVACACEITFLTFRALPAGQVKARRVFAFLAVLIVVGAAGYPGPTASAFDWTFVVGRVTYGVAFLFVAYLGLTAYYHVPVDPVHRDVAHGFVLLSVLVAFRHQLAELDVILGWGRHFVVKISYPLLLAWWARRAWAPEEPTALSREVMQDLQPWRVKRIQWS